MEFPAGNSGIPARDGKTGNFTVPAGHFDDIPVRDGKTGNFGVPARDCGKCAIFGCRHGNGLVCRRR